MICYRCGSKSHKADSETCPARDKVCKNCNKKGHFQKQCRGPMYKSKITNQARQVQCVEVENSSKPSPESKEFTVFSMLGNEMEEMVRWINLNGQKIQALADTGAGANILPSGIISDLEIMPTSAKVTAYGGFPIKVLGESVLPIQYNDIECVSKFIIVDSDKYSIPLLSGKLCKELGILKEIANLHALDSSFEIDKVFNGIGVVQNYEYSLELESDAKPIFFPARKLPPAIIEEVNAEIQKLVDLGIIRKIENSTEWCSPLVVARKKNGQIRLCTDFRSLNKYVKIPHFPIPDMLDIFSRLENSEIFSLLDCSSAFHQIKISPESQPLLTFATSIGRFCWTRLPYGLRSSPEVFQNLLSNLLKDIPKVFVFFDDILIAASNKSEHDEILSQVLNKLRTSGITLNKEKSRIGQNQVEFLGHLLSSEGISPHPSKISAITKMPLPSSKEKLRSFLGLASYIGQRFVPNYASKVSIL